MTVRDSDRMLRDKSNEKEKDLKSIEPKLFAEFIAYTEKHNISKSNL